MKKSILPNRKSVRLKGYDYASIGYYFITINSKDKRCIFGEIKDEVMHPNLLGEIIQEEWDITGKLRDNIKLHEYVLMPNHFHAIVEVCNSMNNTSVPGDFHNAAKSLGSIVRNFKGAVTRKHNSLKLGNEKGVWHVRYYDRIIRDERELLNVKNYIDNNVKNWKGC